MPYPSARRGESSTPARGRGPLRPKALLKSIISAGALLVALPGASGAATLAVSPSGSDSGSCTSAAPCQSFNKAFSVAQPGDTVSLGSGSYGGQSVSGSKAAPGVTLRAAGPITLAGGLSISASNVTVIGPITTTTLSVNGGTAGARNVVVDGITADHQWASGSAAAYVASVDGLTIRNSEFMDNTDSSLVFMDAGPGIHVQNVVYDRDVFHDNKTSPNSGVHTECLYAAAGDKVTVRNSHFYRCRTMDLFITQAAADSMWPTNYTVENNLFEYSIMPDGSPHAYGLVFRDGSPVNGAIVRNNTLQQPLNLPTEGASGAKSYFYSNAVDGPIECLSGPVYAYNVTTSAKCAGTGNKQVSSLGLGSDFHPSSGTSAVVDAGDPANSTSTDADGGARAGAAPDAGAYEFASGGTPPPPPPPPPPPADTTPPDTTITAKPTDGTATGASFSFTATESGSTFACKLDSGTYASCTSPRSYTGLTTGAHTFSVRATDAAGNTDASPATATWTISSPPPPGDTTAPETTITSAPAPLEATSSATLTFTATETATFTCRLDGATWTACQSPLTYTNLAAGSHQFEVRAKDAAGNVDATPAGTAWTVLLPLPPLPVPPVTTDPAPPTTPVPPTTDPAPLPGTDPPSVPSTPTVPLTVVVGLTGKGAPAATITGDGVVTRVEFWLDQKLLCTDSTAPYACASSVLNRLGSGTHVLTARVYTATGEVISQSITLSKARARTATLARASRAASSAASSPAYIRTTVTSGRSGGVAQLQGAAGRAVKVSLARCSDRSGRVVRTISLTGDQKGAARGSVPADGAPLCTVSLSV
jgi:hypothetical protein